MHAKEMVRKFSVYLLLVIGVSNDIYTQDMTVNTIQFEGVNRNKIHFLCRNMETDTGKTLDVKVLENDIQTLNSLSSIANTEYQIDTTQENTLDLTIKTLEASTAFPTLNIALVEGNVWFKVGYNSLNLFGIGHQIKGGYQYSDDFHNFDFYYKVPYWGRSNWGNSISLLKYKSIEPLFFDEGAVDYEYEIQNIGVSTSYTFRPNHWVEGSIAYFVENYEQAKVQELVSPPGPASLKESKSLAKLGHQIRKLKYNYHQLDGWKNRIEFQYVQNFENGSHFVSFLDELSFYKTVGRNINLVSRFRFGIATDNGSPFAPYVLDSYVNIRGVGNRVDRGTAQATLNLEYRYTVFNKNNFVGQLVAFSDQGNWRTPGGTLDQLVGEENYRHFVGAGIRLIYLKGYNYILRVDYGFDISNVNNKGPVLGIGQYF